MDRTLWRALIRVVNLDNRTVWFAIPGWNGGHLSVGVQLDSLPDRVVSCLCIGKRLHAKINLAAKDASEMIFENWELT